VPLTNIVTVFLERIAPIFNAASALLLDQMVSQVDGETFAPVAAFIVDENRIAPPVVQYFMRIRGVQDKREADHLRSQQGERRHAVAGFPEIFNQGEFFVRIPPDQLPVHFDIAGGSVEIFSGQRFITLMKIDQNLNRAGRVAFNDQRTTEKIHLFQHAAGVPASVSCFIS